MSAISVLNPKAEIARASHSLAINISAAKGLQEILKSNLGPKGTMKMFVFSIFFNFLNKNLKNLGCEFKIKNN